MILLKDKVVIHADVFSQEVWEDTILLDLKSENYYGLGGVGTRVWLILKKKDNLQAVFDVLVDEYDVEEKQLKEDLQKLVTQLVAARIVILKPWLTPVNPKKTIFKALYAETYWAVEIIITSGVEGPSGLLDSAPLNCIFFATVWS